MFLDDISDKISEYGYKNQVVELSKNGVLVKGIRFLTNVGISPIFYLEDSDFDPEATAKRMISLFKRVGDVESPNLDFMHDYSLVRPKLAAAICSRDKERGSAACVHSKKLDIDIYARVNVVVNGVEGTIKVTDQLIDLWEVSVEDVICDAMKNSFSKTEIRNLEQLMSIPSPVPMYVVNFNTPYGAIGMFDVDTLHRFCIDRKYTKLIILPSSIHEVILLPDMFEDNDKIIEMVRTINDTEIDEKERLSYSVYSYDDLTQEVTIR